MAAHVLAFSIDKQIEQIGAIAGLAAILGLAVLSLLYFAQAREVKRLREWAGRAPERDAELQQRVAEDAARRTSGGTPAAPAAKPAAATAAGQTAVNKPATAAGAATAKPAAPAATPPGTPAATPAAKPATPGAPGTATPAGAPAATPGTPVAKPATPGTPAPATGAKPAVPATGAPAAAKPATPAPATAAAGAPRPRRTVQVGSGAAGGASATVPPAAPPEDDGERFFSPRAIGFTALAAVLVVGVLLVSGVIGGGDDAPESKGAKTNATQTTDTTGATTTDTGGAIPAPEDTSVAVLNGTTVTGLARQAADKLVAKGYSVGRVTDAADQAQQTSQVAYADGFEGSARRIARLVEISASNIVPLDASTSAVAGDGVSVVVTMGADKATQ